MVNFYPHELLLVFVFFFNDTATTEIYTLSLHDALPIYPDDRDPSVVHGGPSLAAGFGLDRKSTRLNSSHVSISYAVFCLKKKTITSNRPASMLQKSSDYTNGGCSDWQ